MIKYAGECMPWQGYINAQGYGRAKIGKGRTKSAHTVEWEKVNGPVPKGMVLDHLCRNRACANIAHLELVTPKINTLRGVGPTAVNARKELCHLGHPLGGENLIIDCRGNRRCRECQRNSDARYKERRKMKEQTK